MKFLSIALPKGRLFEPAVELFRKLGLVNIELKENSRQLILTDTESRLKFIIVRAHDIPTYVEHGAADFGIVGKDVLLEKASDVYQPLDLKFGECRLSIAGPNKMAKANFWDELLHRHVRVATKFPHLAKQYFDSKGIQADYIKLYGSIELAPLTGLADLIVDIVDTGKTLKANGLTEIEPIMQVSSWLIVNKVSLTTEFDRVDGIIKGLQRLVQQEEKSDD